MLYKSFMIRWWSSGSGQCRADRESAVYPLALALHPPPPLRPFRHCYHCCHYYYHCDYDLHPSRSSSIYLGVCYDIQPWIYRGREASFPFQPSPSPHPPLGHEACTSFVPGSTPFPTLISLVPRVPKAHYPPLQGAPWTSLWGSDMMVNLGK